VITAKREEANMPHTHTPTDVSGNPSRIGRAYEIITALSMTVGRGAAARAVADLAAVRAGDRVVDIGCGPGTAVREAVHRGATATGVDPSPVMLRLARQISALRRMPHIAWLEGSAEALSLPDGDATIVWALSSVHHWQDRAAGLAEAHRVLDPGGQLVLAERRRRPGARGHAAHGLTSDQADRLATDMIAAGFVGVHTETRNAGRRRLVIVCGTRPASD
jgi:ubiquinone/menaquinone biosynthesis C-methylase UbiE